jgi:glycosyltransferase involved in cell wall biosynthesis
VPKLKQGFYWTLEKFTATLAHHLLSQSREDVETAVERGLSGADKVLYLGNGINVSHFRPFIGEQERLANRQSLGLSAEDVVVGAVGRLVYEKGFAELFVAAEELTRKHPELHFIIIGGQDEGQSDSIPPVVVERLRATGHVHFIGWQQEITEWYSAMDLFVLPSHREGIPRACMEAAAMELPVIATDIRGCREVVKHGASGLLVPVGDPESLSLAIEKFAADPGLRRAMGIRGRRHIVENFDQLQVLERLINFYAQIAPLPREVTAACATS